MPRFPYMNFPFPFYKTPPRGPSDFYGFSNGNINANYKNSNNSPSNLPSNTSDNICNQQFKAHSVENTTKNYDRLDKKNKSNKNNEDCLFDLFGLKIYSDDVLLISLIYFLYSEEVKDDGLFIVLILLLLS